jgi:hypothetical protein
MTTYVRKKIPAFGAKKREFAACGESGIKGRRDEPGKDVGSFM